MADIFATKDVQKLLHKKYVLFLGSSTMRGIYKDFVLLTCRNQISALRSLQIRGEASYEGDQRIAFSGLMKGRQYEEERIFSKFDVQMEYHFITRCFSIQIENLFKKIKNRERKVPDIVIMNSCIWDISRWGPNGVEAYKENMQKLMTLLKDCLPEKTLFIWTTTLPVSTEIRGGLIIKQLNFMQDLLRFEVMEANLFCRQLVVSYGYDVLDTHYYLRMQVHRRLKDGLHYGPLPTRFMTNLILTHIALSWNVPLPGNISNVALRRIVTSAVHEEAVPESIPERNDLKESTVSALPRDEPNMLPRNSENSVLEQALTNAVSHAVSSLLFDEEETGEKKQSERKKNIFEHQRGKQYSRGRGSFFNQRQSNAINQRVSQNENDSRMWAYVRENLLGLSRNGRRFQHSSHNRGGPAFTRLRECGQNNYANFEIAGPLRRPFQDLRPYQPNGRRRPYIKRLFDH